MVGGQDYTMELLSNVHDWIEVPDGVSEEAVVVRGDYLYFHYGCDGFDDRGWGCGYRTLMTLCSWVRGQLALATPTTVIDAHTTDAPTAAPPIPLSQPPVPSNRRIQELLVEIGDKEESFVGSKQWIGCVEVSYVLDSLYNTPCKIIHIQRGSELCDHMDTLREHFVERGSPVMMGGNTDNASKAIMGMCEGPEDSYLLVVDPHFWGIAKGCTELQMQRWVKWQPLSEFTQGSFYNLCLPQLSAHQPTMSS